MTDLPGLLKALKIMTVMNGKAWRCSPAALDELNAAIAAERQSGEGRDCEIERVAIALLDHRGFGFYAGPMEGGQDAYDLSQEALEEARIAITALRAKPSGTFAEAVEEAAKIADQAEAAFRKYRFNRQSEPTQRSMDMALLARSIRALTPPPPPEVRGFQNRVGDWLLACFGAEISNDKQERNHRFLEEAIELVQACGCTQSEAHQLVDYVYDRDQGDVNQEVGGVMVTLAALCRANGFDMQGAGETELMRVWTKVETIRAKQAAKPKHSPLPEVRGDEMSAAARDYAGGAK